MFEREPDSTEIRLSGFGQKSVIVKYNDGSADSSSFNRTTDVYPRKNYLFKQRKYK